MCVPETLKLFNCGDEFLFIHMERRVNVQTPRVRFKTIQREGRRGGEEYESSRYREKQRSGKDKEGEKMEKEEKVRDV